MVASTPIPPKISVLTKETSQLSRASEGVHAGALSYLIST